MKRIMSFKAGFGKVAAALICLVILGTGITVVAKTSDQFRSWLSHIFGEEEVEEINLRGEQQPDITADENGVLAFEENIKIYGNQESFVCEYHMEGEEEIIDRVYGIWENGLKKIETSSYENEKTTNSTYPCFRGEYEGGTFSFEYAVWNGEILGFHYKGNIQEVFHSIKKDTVYAVLWDADKDRTDKGCIVSLNLATKEVTKLSDNNMNCNFIMSPNGRMLLCNHRAEEYWSVFDIEERTERRLEHINGYNRTGEIQFLDDYHILTLGQPFMKDKTEWYSTYAINLRTREITDEYKDYGDINMEWSYTVDKKQLNIYSIINKDSIVVDHVGETIQLLDAQGDYALFGQPEDEDSDFCLVNLKKQTFRNIHIPKELSSNLEMHLAVKEEKLLITNGCKVYLVDVSEI